MPTGKEVKRRTLVELNAALQETHSKGFDIITNVSLHWSMQMKFIAMRVEVLHISLCIPSCHQFAGHTRCGSRHGWIELISGFLTSRRAWSS